MFLPVFRLCISFCTLLLCANITYGADNISIQTGSHRYMFYRHDPYKQRTITFVNPYYVKLCKELTTSETFIPRQGIQIGKFLNAIKNFEASNVLSEEAVQECHKRLAAIFTQAAIDPNRTIHECLFYAGEAVNHALLLSFQPLHDFVLGRAYTIEAHLLEKKDLRACLDSQDRALNVIRPYGNSYDISNIFWGRARAYAHYGHYIYSMLDYYDAFKACDDPDRCDRIVKDLRNHSHLMISELRSVNLNASSQNVRDAFNWFNFVSASIQDLN